MSRLWCANRPVPALLAGPVSFSLNLQYPLGSVFPGLKVYKRVSEVLDTQQGVVHNMASYFSKGLDMINIPLAQAKNHLSELIGRVERGEAVAVTRRGKPVVQLVVYPTEGSPQQGERVQQVFDRLRLLRSGVSLEGDLKTIAREGLA